MKLEIEQDLAQAIANYLQTKPFKEVHLFIADLMQCKKITDPKPDIPNKDDDTL